MQSVDLNFRMNATGNAVPEIRKAQGAVQRLGTQIDKSNARMRGFNNGITTMQANSRKFAMSGLQQAGYQIGDYAVQVANGTSKMQAFGQQAPQLLQIFGPIGAIVGAGVAIFAAFAVAMQRSKAEVVDASKAFDGLLAQLKRVNDLGSGVVDFGALLRREFKDSKSEVKGFIDSLIALEQVKVLEKLSAGFSGISGQLASTADELYQLEGRRSGLQAQLTMLDETDARYSQIATLISEIDTEINKVGASTMDVNNIFNQINSVVRETDPIKLVAGLAKAKATAEEIGGPVGRMVLTAITEAAQKADVLGAMETAAANATRDAASAAAELADEMNRAVTPAERFRDVVFDPRSPRFDPILAEFARLQLQIEETNDSAVKLSSSINRVANIRSQIARDNEVVFDPRDPRYNKTRAQMAQIALEIENASRSGGRAGKSIARGMKEAAVEVNTQLTPAMQRLKSVQDTVSGAFESGFMSMIDGTKSVKDAFKSMASEIIKELYRIFVVKRITGMISSAIGGYFNMNQVSGPSLPLGTGNIRPPTRSFAGGGYTGNGARAGGLDGKGGYMAMIHPRETVVDHTKGQGSGVTVIQNNTFGNGVSRAEVNAMLPKMVEATKAAVADAKLRGGSYGRSFA